MLLWHEKYSFNQAPTLHMPRQPSCRGMCKIVTWLGHCNTNYYIFRVLSTWKQFWQAHKQFYGSQTPGMWYLSHSCYWRSLACLPPGGRFKNAYELLNLRALKIAILFKKYIFQCMGKIFLCGISKGTFEIPHKISYPYIERGGFY